MHNHLRVLCYVYSSKTKSTAADHYQPIFSDRLVSKKGRKKVTSGRLSSIYYEAFSAFLCVSCVKGQTFCHAATLLTKSEALWRLFQFFGFSISGLGCVHLTDGWSRVSNIYEKHCVTSSRVVCRAHLRVDLWKIRLAAAP